MPRDIKRESLSNRRSIIDSASLYVPPRLAELFLERWANLNVADLGKIERFRKSFVSLLPRFSPLMLSPSILAAGLVKEESDFYFWAHATPVLRDLWQQPNPLRKKAWLMTLAGSYMDKCGAAPGEQRGEDRFLMVLVYAVEHAHLLRYCLNPKCEEPYFVARRGSQIYCSQPCAEPAKREAKVRWWREHRAKRPAKSRKKRGKHAQAA